MCGCKTSGGYILCSLEWVEEHHKRISLALCQCDLLFFAISVLLRFCNISIFSICCIVVFEVVTRSNFCSKSSNLLWLFEITFFSIAISMEHAPQHLASLLDELLPTAADKPKVPSVSFMPTFSMLSSSPPTLFPLGPLFFFLLGPLFEAILIIIKI